MPLTSEQKLQRQQIVTATDLVKLTGVYPGNKGACDVYAEKIEAIDRDDDQFDLIEEETDQNDQADAIAFGHYFEPRGLAAVARKYSLEVRPGVTQTSRLYPFLGATPDGIAFANGKLVGVCEAKFVGPHRFSHWVNGVPEYVKVQATVQMIVCEVDVCYVVAGLGTNKRYFIVEKDSAEADALVYVAEHFYTKHLVPRVPPKANGSNGAHRMLQTVWPRPTADLITAPEEAEVLAQAFIKMRKIEAEAGTRKKKLQQQLCELINEHEGIEGETWLATWKERQETVVPSHVRAAYRHFDLREKNASSKRLLR